MSDNTIINNNNKVSQNAFKMAERQSSANTTSNNLVNRLQPTQQQQFNILQQLNLPLSIPPPPAAFQLHSFQPVAPKLNASAPIFTPNPFSTLPPSKTPNSVQGYDPKSAQIAVLQKAINESLAKLQILALQLNTLQLINQQNQTIQSLNQYQTIYQQYHLEFTNGLVLNQYMNNIRNQTQNNDNNTSLVVEKDTTKDKKAGVAQLETIEEGEDEEEQMEDDEHIIAQIAGLSTDITPKSNNEDEGTSHDLIAKKVDEALAVYAGNENIKKIGEQLADINTVRNLYKFPNATMTETVSGETKGEKRKVSELEKIKKQIRGILNKITPENFDKLSQEIASILKVAEITDGTRSNEEVMIAQKAQFKALIKLILRCILEKAINESLFSNQYARLCYSLYLYAEDNELKKKLFRQQLLSLCHSVFKKARNNGENTRFIGIITMIGELFTYGLVSWNVISSGIFDQLLPPENSLDIEAVCKLLKTSGNDFDRHHYKEINRVIVDLMKYAQKFDFRVRCLVKEIDEMRQNDWSQKIKKEAPMTLNQIHKEFNKENKKKKVSTYRPSKRNEAYKYNDHHNNNQNNNNQRAQRWRNNGYESSQQRGGSNNNRWRGNNNNNNNKQYGYNGGYNGYNGGYNGYNNHHNNSYNSQHSHSTRRKSKNLRPTVEFVKDVTLPDRSHYPSNKCLTKTWAMRNSGELPWGDNVELVYFKGDESLSLEDRYPVINAVPGQEVRISASIRTPTQPGRYCTYFRLQKNGKFFGPRVWVDIIVSSNNLTPKSMDGRKHCATNYETNNRILSCQ